jgi:hypothetical protein
MSKVDNHGEIVENSVEMCKSLAIIAINTDLSTNTVENLSTIPTKCG